MRLFAICAVGAVVALLVTFGIGAAQEGATPPLSESSSARVVTSDKAGFNPRGTGSCAARACHGNTDPVSGSPVLRTEYTTWITRDKHNQAFQVLRETRSAQIISKLGWNNSADQESRCLACHATPVGSLAGHKAAVVQEDGVSCEACHGASGGWLSEHTTHRWSKIAAEEKFSKFGMVPTAHLEDRARVCVGCHVGSPPAPERGFPVARDVNHDLIAAGHPRLAFEFAAYHRLMPKHWIEREPATDFQARAWAIGQIATARAALELLSGRAGNARGDQGTQPWPEFSEYGCFTCHFELGSESARFSDRRNPLAPLGQPVWGTWHMPMLRELSKPSSGLGRADVARLLDTLGRIMNQPVPPPDTAASQAKQAAQVFGDWLDDLKIKPLLSRDLLTILSKPASLDQSWEISSWDQAAQLYFALRALNHPNLDDKPIDPSLDAELGNLLKKLTFEPGFESPQGSFPRTLFEK